MDSIYIVLPTTEPNELRLRTMNSIRNLLSLVVHLHHELNRDIPIHTGRDMLNVQDLLTAMAIDAEERPTIT